jgi:hypothetical protein
MLRAGWATTYEQVNEGLFTVIMLIWFQSSAQYGEEGKDAYIATEKEAKYLQISWAL